MKIVFRRVVIEIDRGFSLLALRCNLATAVFLMRLSDYIQSYVYCLSCRFTLTRSSSSVVLPMERVFFYVVVVGFPSKFIRIIRTRTKGAKIQQ